MTKAQDTPARLRPFTHTSLLALALLAPTAACDAGDDPSFAEDEQLRAYSDGSKPASNPSTLIAGEHMQLADGTGNCTDNTPRYGPTAVTHEVVGVNPDADDGGEKIIEFGTYQREGENFEVELFQYNNKPKATVELHDMENNEKVKCSVPGKCTATGFSPNIKMVVTAESNTSFVEYSTNYTKKCDPIAGRYCSDECEFDDVKLTFGQNGHTETSKNQGDIELFAVEGGDLARLKFTSNKALKNTPTLRVHATTTNEENQAVDVRLGSKYPCTATGMVDNTYRYECAIPFDDAVPSTEGYDNPYLKLSSARVNPGATFRIWATARNRLAPYTCGG